MATRSKERQSELAHPKGAFCYDVSMSQQRQQTHIRNGVVYSVNKLQDLASGLPIEEAKLSDLGIDFDKPLWKDESTKPPTKYSPNDVIAHKDDNQFFHNHYLRAMESDLNEPILLDGEHHRVVDGYHRLLKAKLLGQELIKTRTFTQLPNEAIEKSWPLSPHGPKALMLKVPKGAFLLYMLSCLHNS